MDLNFTQISFYIFAAVLVFAALRVITARNPIYAVLNLVLAFFSTACIWMQMQAEFLAIAIVLVYVGAVMVLFLFVVMMIDINLERLRQGFWSYLPFGLVVGGIMVVEMGMVLGGKYFAPGAVPIPAPAAANYNNTKEIARVLFTDYAYPFELASLVLLVGMIAAVVLTLRHREGVKYTDPAKQVAVKRADRVRIVKMAVEKSAADKVVVEQATVENK